MRNPNNFLVIVFLALAVSSAKSQDLKFKPSADPAALAREIELANSKITSLQCNFSQEKELSFLEEKVFSSGVFLYEKENKIRWEYQIPYSYIIIMNENLIKIIEEDKSNRLDASSNRLFSSINTVMAGIIDGSVIQDRELFESSFTENEKMVRVVMLPLVPGMKEFISAIELDLSKENYTVDALKIIEKSGDYTLIRFNDKKFNAAIPENTFRVN